jgi:hypothetical protein
MTPQRTHHKEEPMQKRPPCRPAGKHVAKAILAVVALGLVFYMLWNWAAVPLFTFPSLTYLQVLGAILLMGAALLIGIHTIGRGRRGQYHHSAPGGCRFSRCRPDPARDA